MERRNQDRERNNFHQREDILLETNFDEDGAMTMAHRSNLTHPKQNGQYNAVNSGTNDQWQRSNGRKNFYRSDTSIDRYSEYSLHGRREQGIFNEKLSKYCRARN